MTDSPSQDCNSSPADYEGLEKKEEEENRLYSLHSVLIIKM